MFLSTGLVESFLTFVSNVFKEEELHHGEYQVDTLS